MSLKKLFASKLFAGLSKYDPYISREMWLASLDADQDAMFSLQQAWPGFERVYDQEMVAQALGYAPDSAITPCSPILPTAEPGTITLWYDDWTIADLRCAPSASAYISGGEDLEEMRTSVGYYRLQIPIPGTAGLSFEQQGEMLESRKEHLASLPFLLTALVVHKIQTGQELGADAVLGSAPVSKTIGGAKTWPCLYWHNGQIHIFDRNLRCKPCQPYACSVYRID